MNPTTNPMPSWTPSLTTKTTGDEDAQQQVPNEDTQHEVPILIDKAMQQICDDLYNTIAAHNLQYSAEDEVIYKLIQRMRDRRAGVLEQTSDEIAELKDKAQIVTKHIDVFNGLLNQMTL